MKMAAAEALWESDEPGLDVALHHRATSAERRDVFAIRVPGLLSFLAYNRFDGEVKGINELQAEYEQRYGPGDYVPAGEVDLLDASAPWSGAGMVMLAARRPGPSGAVLRERFEQSPRLAGVARAGHRPALPRQQRRLDLHRDRPPALDRLRPAEDRGRRSRRT